MNKNIRASLIGISLSMYCLSYTVVEPLTIAKITELKKLRADRLLPQITTYLSPDSPWSQGFVDALNQLINDYENKSKAKIKANELRTQLTLMWQTAQQSQGKQAAEKELALARAEIERLQNSMQDIVQTRGKQIETLVKKRAQETEKAKKAVGAEKEFAQENAARLQKTIDALTRANTTYEQALADATQKMKDMQTQKTGAEQALAAALKRIEEIAKRAELAEAKQKEMAPIIKELETQKKDLEQRIIIADTQAQKLLQQAKTESGATQKIAQEEASRLQKQIEKLTQENKTYQDSIADLEKKKQAVEEEKSGSEDTLKAALKEKQNQLNALQQRTVLAQEKQQEIANLVQQLTTEKTELENRIIATEKRAQEMEKQAKSEKDALKKEFNTILAANAQKAQEDMDALRKQMGKKQDDLQNSIDALRAGTVSSEVFENQKNEIQQTVKALQEAKLALEQARKLNANRLLRLVILRRTKQKSEQREAAIKKDLAAATDEQKKVLQEKITQEQLFRAELEKVQKQEAQNRQKAETEMETLRKQSADSSQQLATYEKQIQALQEASLQAEQQRRAAEKIAEQKSTELTQKIKELETTIAEKNSTLEKLGKEKIEERETLQKEIQALQDKINGVKEEEQKQGWFASWFGGPQEERKSSAPLTPEERKARREKEKGTEMEEMEATPTAQEVYDFYQGLPS